MANKKIFSAFIATIAASLCCITPVLAVLAGSSSLASSFSWMEPYHNYLVGLTILVLIYAWWDKLRVKKDEIDCACDESRGFFSGKIFLALVTVFSSLMLSFPYWGYSYFGIEAECNSCETQVVKKAPVVQKKLSNCASEQECDDSQKRDTKTVIYDDLPVLKYMNDEKNNPTDCGQVACSGTGYKELDDMIEQVRAEVQEMSPAVLKKMLDNDEELTLIDVREAIQRAEGEIYASESYAIPRTNLEFEILNKIKDKNAVIVLYSRQGARSLLAALSIQKLGYKHVYNLSAGLKGWVRAEYPYDNGLGTVLKVVDAQ